MHTIQIQFPGLKLTARWLRRRAGGLKRAVDVVWGMTVVTALATVVGFLPSDPILAVAGIAVGFAAGWHGKK